MRSPKKILIVAGEPSGDLHASRLVEELNSLEPDLKFFGIGGSLLKGSGVRIIFDISGLALIGASEVLKNIFTVRVAYKRLLKEIDSVRPGLAILVDYPGFNLRLAKELKERSIPVAYYISPQVWAWGEGRIKTIKECVRKIIVFFKFEEGLYKKHGIDAEFVGHPLLDSVRATSSKEETIKKYGLAKDKRTVVLLPGSRAAEVKTLLPIMLASCAIVAKKVNGIQYVIAKFKDLAQDLYENEMRNSNLDIKLVDGDTYNILAASDFAIVASGTATLETAIMGTPFLIVYKVSALTYILYKFVAKTKFLGLVNIIARKAVVPELLQFDATPEHIAAEAIGLIADKGRLDTMRDELKAVKSSLGPSGASRRAAGAILPLLQE